MRIAGNRKATLLRSRVAFLSVDFLFTNNIIIEIIYYTVMNSQTNQGIIHPRNIPPNCGPSFQKIFILTNVAKSFAMK